MLQAQTEVAWPDSLDEFCKTLVSHSPAILMEAGEEVAARREALVGDLRVAVEVGLPEGCVADQEDILLESLDAFWRALTNETPARVAPMRVRLKQGADLTQVKAKPRVYPPEKSAWLKECFELLCETGILYPEPAGDLCECGDGVSQGTGQGIPFSSWFFPPSTASASWCRGRCGTLRSRVRRLPAPWLFIRWTAFKVTGSARC